MFDEFESILNDPKLNGIVLNIRTFSVLKVAAGLELKLH